MELMEATDSEPTGRLHPLIDTHAARPVMELMEATEPTGRLHPLIGTHAARPVLPVPLAVILPVL